ncbi:Hypothetical protein NGAL_HAMBI1146_39990 [Neorhizobium galegae bv. officinalis]|jgi:hypothetical protein|nr:Hypothetical protein NGAL_HAMBI1146_39990 [Neorhizobium galegae bv. officinalis]
MSLPSPSLLALVEKKSGEVRDCSLARPVEMGMGPHGMSLLPSGEKVPAGG